MHFNPLSTQPLLLLATGEISPRPLQPGLGGWGFFSFTVFEIQLKKYSWLIYHCISGHYSIRCLTYLTLNGVRFCHWSKSDFVTDRSQIYSISCLNYLTLTGVRFCHWPKSDFVTDRSQILVTDRGQILAPDVLEYDVLEPVERVD